MNRIQRWSNAQTVNPLKQKIANFIIKRLCRRSIILPTESYFIRNNHADESMENLLSALPTELVFHPPRRQGSIDIGTGY